MTKVSLTCKKFLADFEGVYQRGEDAFDGAEHAAQPEVHQHQEEHDGPEGRRGEMCHGLREGDEGQTCSLDRLLEEERRRRGKISVALRGAFFFSRLWVTLRDLLTFIYNYPV